MKVSENTLRWLACQPQPSQRRNSSGSIRKSSVRASQSTLSVDIPVKPALLEPVFIYKYPPPLYQITPIYSAPLNTSTMPIRIATSTPTTAPGLSLVEAALLLQSKGISVNLNIKDVPSLQQTSPYSSQPSTRNAFPEGLLKMSTVPSQLDQALQIVLNAGGAVYFAAKAATVATMTLTGPATVIAGSTTSANATAPASTCTQPIHQTTSNQSGPRTCTTCGEVFQTQQSLDSHMEVIDRSCTFCRGVFPCRNAFVDHHPCPSFQNLADRRRGGT